jgi:hypothetical protein
LPATAKNITLNYSQPYLYPKQKAAIFDPHRVAVIEASSKSGKTSGCVVWLFEQALKGKKNQNYWWIAPVHAQALIAFNRMRRAIDPSLIEVNLGRSSVTLINGAVISFLSADNPDVLYGEDVYAAVVDEASRMKHDAYIALRTTLTATQGPMRIIGNVKGRKNWFYEMARRAEQGENPDLAYHRLTADDAVAAGVFPEEEIESARRSGMPEAVFRELYYAEASDDQGNPFGIDAIRKCIIPQLSTRKPEVWGWDLAKSHDWTVGIGLDSEGYVCRFERWQSPWEATYLRIQGLTNNQRALVDSTGVGDPVLERLQKHPGSKFEGYKFTPGSKQQLMEGLAVAIQTQAVRFPAGPITQELEIFEYEYRQTACRYSAPEGYKDDCVMALALAVQHRMHSKPRLVITHDILQRAKSPMWSKKAYMSKMGTW